jgi:hypothetical protein
MTDISLTAAQVISNSPNESDRVWGVATEAVAAGEAIIDESGAVSLADCTDADLANCSGVALCDAAAGQPVQYAKGGPLQLTTGSALGVDGLIMILSEAGGIAPIADVAQDDIVTILGVLAAGGKILNLAINATGVVYNPS